MRAGSVDVQGELVGNIMADATVFVRANGRLFGNVQARNLVVEAGAVLVGQMSIGEQAKG